MKAFRAYDVRGIYGKDITDADAHNIAKAYSKAFNLSKIAIGRDMRPSSPRLMQAAIKGFLETGVNVIDIGMCTTPMLGFCVAKKKLDGGIMITASHSPKCYNGMKILGKDALQIHEGNGLKKIENLVIAKKETEKKPRKGIYRIMDILPDYLKHLQKYSRSIKGLKVIVDAGNGVGGIAANPLLKQLNIKAKKMYFFPDGNFPNHEANPMKENTLKNLIQEVKKHKADIGIAFDGDADRVRIIDDTGYAVPTDFLFAALMEHELPKAKTKKIYYDLRFSKVLRDVIKRTGAKGSMMRVGNPFYKEKLLTSGGYAAAELSGHIMYKDNYCLDDGLFAAIKVMNLLCSKKTKDKKDNKDDKNNKTSMSEIIKGYKKFCQSPEINFKLKDAKKAMLKLEKELGAGTRISKLDGVTITKKQYWFNARASNTEPLLRVRIEAVNEKTLSEIENRIRDILKGC